MSLCLLYRSCNKFELHFNIFFSTKRWKRNKKFPLKTKGIFLLLIFSSFSLPISSPVPTSSCCNYCPPFPFRFSSSPKQNINKRFALFTWSSFYLPFHSTFISTLCSRIYTCLYLAMIKVIGLVAIVFNDFHFP